MAFHMILEGGVLKAVPQQAPPVVFNGEIHPNAKWMGGMYPCRGPAVEIVAPHSRKVVNTIPVIQQAPEEPAPIILPKAQKVIDLTAPSAFAAATIAFDEPEDEPGATNEEASEAGVDVPAVFSADTSSEDPAPNIGMTVKEFGAYQLKGAQVRKVYELTVSPDSSEVGVSKMTKSIIEASQASVEASGKVLQVILDVKRGAL